MLNSLGPSLYGDGLLGLRGGQRVAIFINKNDSTKLLEAMGIDLDRERLYAFPSDDEHVRRGAAMIVKGVRVWLSELVPEGSVILLDPTGRPIPAPVGTWKDIAGMITALALADVDEKVGS